MKNQKLIILILSTLMISFTACGGGGGGSSSSLSRGSLANDYESGVVGRFIDSPVIGLNYSCDGETKKTDSLGLFNCENLPIDFHVGNLVLGSIVEATEDYLILPQDVLNQPRSAALHPEVTKMVVVLQSLDSDGDASNGIDIQQNTIELLNQEVLEGTNVQNISLVDLSSTLGIIVGNDTQNQLHLVTAYQAQDHLLSSISSSYEIPIQP